MKPLLILNLSIIFLLACQSENILEINYEKREFRIPMRDGKKLFTTVYTPKDTSQVYPILFKRTPYSVRPYGQHTFPKKIDSWRHLIEEQFIFVFQDVRGKYMSEGTYVNMRPYLEIKNSAQDIDESSDTYDTIEWLMQNIPNQNGRVGMWGISYPGFYAAMGALDAHPALYAVSPQAPIADWFIGDDFHHNGAFGLNLAFSFFYSFSAPRPQPTTERSPRFEFPTSDGYDFFLKLGPLPEVNRRYFHNERSFWNDLMTHGTYDAFWQERSTIPDFNNVRPAVLTVGGWFDAEDCYGALQTYRAIEERNPGITNILVMGPWYHGGWVRSDGSHLGPVSFGSTTGDYYEEEIELPFFRHFLKNDPDYEPQEAYVFTTGSNQWETHSEWPPSDTQMSILYLGPNEQLNPEKPPAGEELYDEYISDPKKPVPYTAQTTIRIRKEFMIEDQHFATRRPDVLVYQSDILTEDLTIAGPVSAEIFVSTSGSDSDWIVKLIDVFPNDYDQPPADESPAVMAGYQMLLRGEIMRGKFRDSFENPKPMIPDRVTRIKLELNDVYHTFQEGHRIMIQIQSSWFPLFDRNPQKFVDIYQAETADFERANQRVYRSERYPSGIRFPVYGD